MPVKRLTSQSQIESTIQKRMQRIRKAVIATLSYVGEQCIREARISGKYTDQTGNLRSSIGYIILDHGRVIKKGSFVLVKDGKKGVNEGKKFRDKLITENNRGIVLIVLAGMDYAKYVEAMGKNVLESSQITAKELVPQMLKQLLKRK